MWKWIKRPVNQKTLTFLGGGLAAVVIAAWAVFNYFYPPKKSAASKPNVQAEEGVAAGGDISVGRDLNINNDNPSTGSEQ